jgi:alkylhydroperoxidase family enzyme
MANTPLQRIPREQLSETAQVAWDQLNKLTNEPTFVEVFANAPDMLDFVMNQFYARIFFGGKVEQKYKQLVRLRLSLIHGCRTCNKQNVPGSLEAGVSQAQVDQIEDADNGPFTDAEKAVIKFAEQMALTNHEGKLDDALYADLHAHFSDAQICELGTVMAVIGGFAKLAFVMDLVEREDYCPFN